jgi:2,3-bisphosphoglycerate-dependent phosphoglycerate mutase
MGPSDATRVVLVRHGQTDWNVERRLQGQTDIGLNALGREQARRLGEALAGDALAAVYSSDLGRALDTARAVAQRQGLPVHTDTGLRERHFGVFEGLTYHEVEARWPEQNARWRAREAGFGPDGGETLQDFHARCVVTLRRLAVPHAGQSILLVAHGGVLDCLYRAASGVPLEAPRGWQLGNASINRLMVAPGGHLRLVGWNDDAHLDGLTPSVQSFS